MTERAPDSYEGATEEYQRRLDAYGVAVAARSPDVEAAFDAAKAAWFRMRELAPPESREAEVDEEMHLVLAFSHALGARHAEEAARLYALMGPTFRKVTDDLEAYAPGAWKIWLRPEAPPPSERASARASARVRDRQSAPRVCLAGSSLAHDETSAVSLGGAPRKGR